MAGVALACWLIFGGLSAAFGQSAEPETAPVSAADATRSLTNIGDAVALDTPALQAVGPSMVTVTPRSKGDHDDFTTTLTGVIVPPREGEPAAGWVVIPYPHFWFKREFVRNQTDEFRNDQARWEAWWKSKLDGASVQGTDWSSTALFVDAQFMLDLVLLQLTEPERGRPAVALNLQPKYEQQPVIVHQADPRIRQAARLTIGFPNDALPWHVDLTDLSQGTELDSGSAVTDVNGQLLGVVSRIDLDKQTPQPYGRDFMYRLIPARYAETIVSMQHAAVIENVANVMIGVAIGKERALVDERDAVRAAATRPQTYAPSVVEEGDEAPRAAAPAPPAETRALKVYALERVSPKVAAQVLIRLFGDRASFGSLPNKRVVTATGPAEVLESVETLLRALDQETETQANVPASESVVSFPDVKGFMTYPIVPQSALRVFVMQHIGPVGALEALRPLFERMVKIGDVNYIAAEFVAVPSRGVLIVRAAPDTLESISALIQTFDTAPTEQRGDPNAAAKPATAMDADGDEATRSLSASGSLDVADAEAAGRPADTERVPVAGSRIDVFPLKNITLNEMQMVLTDLFGQVAKFSSIPSQNAIVVQGHPDVVLAVNGLIAHFDKLEIPPGTKLSPLIMTSPLINEGGQALQPDTQLLIYWLQHLPAGEAATTLVALFGQPQGPMDYGAQVRRFVPVPRNNVLVTRAELDTLKKVSALLKRIDVPSEPNATTESTPNTTEGERIEVGSGDGKPVRYVRQPPNPEDLIAEKLPEAIATLRSEYASLDEKVRLAAWRLKKESNADAAGQRQKDVYDAVGEAFDARQELQHLELRALSGRIESTKRTLATRAKIRDEIVQRRVEELLNPALEWDTTVNGKPPAAGDANGLPIGPDWPVPFVQARKRESVTKPAETGGAPDVVEADGSASVEDAGALSPGTSSTNSPYSAVKPGDRIYRGKSQAQWQSEFAAETDPASKLVAALALVSLAAELPPHENVEQILDVGEEIVRSSYGDRALEFAFDFNMPPKRMLFAGSDEWKANFIQFDNELTSRLAANSPKLLARHIAHALATGSDARAAFAYKLMGRNSNSRIHTNEAAALLIVEGAHPKLDDVDRSALCLLTRLSAAFGIRDKAPELWPEIIALAGQLREPDIASRPLNPRLRETLFRMSAHVGPVLPPDFAPLKPGETGPRVSPEASRGLAELALDSIVRNKQSLYSDWIRREPPDPGFNNLSPYAPTKVSALRDTLGPSLHGFADVATTYFHDHTAPFHAEERAVAKELGVVLSLYSDGDDWEIERTAAMLTAQLRAAYTDDPAKTIDVPMHDLLPADAWTHLAQIVAITGELPDFIRTATPKSKPLADRLATLGRLLAGAVAKDQFERELSTLDGLLGEAPVETIRLLISNTDDSGAVHFGDEYTRSLTRDISDSSRLNADAESGYPLGGFVGGFPPTPTPSKQYIDPLLLLAILHDLQRPDDEARDRLLAEMFHTQLRSGELGDHLSALLKSPLQSRKHAARMLREMAARTGSSELRERLLIIDPTIGDAPATN